MNFRRRKLTDVSFGGQVGEQAGVSRKGETTRSLYHRIAALTIIFRLRVSGMLKRWMR